MIVQCPNCQTKSRVDDAGAARGARVRCVGCSHIFLPLTAVVQPVAAPPAGIAAPEPDDEGFGGKTSLFTGVVAKAALGLPAEGTPQHAGPPAATSVSSATPPRVEGSDGGFGTPKTQAIDVSQLAAFTARAPAARPAGPVAGLQTTRAQPSSPAQAAGASAPASVSTRPPVGEDPSATDVIGVTSRDAEGPVAPASRTIFGLSALILACGIVFFSAGRSVYAALGLLGGQPIAINVAAGDAVGVERATSVVYTLADGHDALVVLGSVRNTGNKPASQVELMFVLRDKGGAVKVQQRAPLGAILSLEELATITPQDNAEAELRRRVRDVPPLPAGGRGQKFMAIITDPPQPLADYSQSLSVVSALPPETAAQTDTPPAAAPTDADPAPAGTAEVESSMPAIVRPQAPAHPAPPARSTHPAKAHSKTQRHHEGR